MDDCRRQYLDEIILDLNYPQLDDFDCQYLNEITVEKQ